MVKNWPFLRWILVGLVSSLLLFYALSGFLREHPLTESEGSDAFAVVIAKRYIPAFSAIEPAAIVIRRFPKAYIPPGALHSDEELIGENKLPRYAAALSIPEGQPLTRALLNDLSKAHGMASLLPVGKVAVSFAVNPVQGVGGWIQPGDCISIFETRREGDVRQTFHKQTRLLFPSVQVLAVDRKRLGLQQAKSSSSEISMDTESGNSVLTVLMNPREAAHLIESRESGHLSALLRPLGDEYE